MANPAAQAQIGLAGYARKYGIPNFGVSWVGNDGETAHLLFIFSDFSKTGNAAVQTATDNNNEITGFNRSQKTRQVRFSAMAAAATISDAEAIAADMPMKMDLISIGHVTIADDVPSLTVGGEAAIDTQIETDGAVLEDATVRWTPEKELVVDFTVTVHLNPDGTIKSFAALN